ncbi:hypothetical protein BJ508DRAFT_313573 [Ascobolus immersus RN42]|uniref:Uncharacterized protein n=1 Tax=Ascobolus immersus RN42 TaxID=1160509 RepID=A0A3N4HVM0_ASCIM|nr:hypothetical protein BJ508DRAFT_313573 [Ascobolus immersus RN42]
MDLKDGAPPVWVLTKDHPLETDIQGTMNPDFMPMKLDDSRYFATFVLNSQFANHGTLRSEAAKILESFRQFASTPQPEEDSHRLRARIRRLNTRVTLFNERQKSLKEACRPHFEARGVRVPSFGPYESVPTTIIAFAAAR